MDAGYGAGTELRTQTAAPGLKYSAGIQPHTSVWPQGAGPMPQKTWSGRGRPASRTRRDAGRQPVQVRMLALGLPEPAWQTITWREGASDWLIPAALNIDRSPIAGRDRGYAVGVVGEKHPRVA